MKSRLFLFIMCISAPVFSQKNKMESDASSDKERNYELQLDIINRYLWRGQCWGGNYAAMQFEASYEIVPKLELGFWATSNFQKDYSYADGSPNKGYQEIDFSVSYYFKDFLYVNVTDYYWPSVERVPGVDNRFFYYGRNGVKTVDLSFNLDRAEDNLDYPWKATFSTLIAGNDFRYDDEGSAKQNFTSYLEVGYKHVFFEESKINIEMTPTIGAVLNNQAEYYTYADYDKVSVCNISVEVGKEFAIGRSEFKLPLSLTYIHNAASRNTEDFGKNFVVAKLSFKY